MGSWAHNTAYNTAQGAAGGLDFLSFGAYAHVAGAFGPRVDTGSTAYQVGYWATGAVLAVKGAATLGAKVLGAGTVAASAGETRALESGGQRMIRTFRSEDLAGPEASGPNITLDQARAAAEGNGI